MRLYFPQKPVKLAIMSIDQERELIEIKELVSENHQILKNLQRRARFGTIFHTIKWIIILVIAFGIYTFVQPILNNLIAAYDSVTTSAANIVNIKNSISGGGDWQNLFNKPK